MKPGLRHNGSIKYLVLCLLGLAMTGGCVTLKHSKPTILHGDLDRGLVIVLTGIEGRSMFNEDICQGLAGGGVPYAIQLYDWTSNYIPTVNLWRESHNHAVAGEISHMIVRYKSAYPNRPVILVGQSGGAAMAVWAAESLPPGENVDGVILIAASLSPQYMLDVALSKSRHGIVNFYSPKDWVLLGIGTTMAGTMDGEHTSSAGKNGFEVPEEGARPGVYRKFFQISWTKEMSATGYTGSHLSSGATRFVARYIAPFVLADKWNNDLVKRVLNSEAGTSVPAPAPKPTPTPKPKPPVDDTVGYINVQKGFGNFILWG